MRQRITYKLCTLMYGVATVVASFDATRKNAPAVGRHWTVRRITRVSSSVGSRAFSVAGPQAWNQQTTSIRQMDLYRDGQAPSKK